MFNAKNRAKAISIFIVLMLASVSAFAVIPLGNAQSNLTVTNCFNEIIGLNSPTKILWIFRPDILTTDPNYIGVISMWPDANITLTRPDGTIADVFNGPFRVFETDVQGAESHMYIIYSPDMRGLWNVSLYWPGDADYNEVNVTATMGVGPQMPKRTSWAMLSIRPNVLGVGQSVLINAWITPPPMTDHQVYENYTFTFLSPSGSSQVVGPMNSETPGTVWFDYPLTEVGNWTITFDFPGDYATMPDSHSQVITVQQDPVAIGYPDTPLPTEPWRFPINVENRNWRTIAGPWYQRYYNASVGSYNPYTEGVSTPHILWKLDSTGQLGGFIGSPHSIQTGGGFEGYPDSGDAGIYTSSVPTIRIIMAGRGYYNSGGQIHCVDMFTGEELWAVDGAADVGCREGRSAVLIDFGNTYMRKYDAITGEQICDVPAVRMYYFDDYNNIAYSYQEISPIGPTINDFTNEFGYLSAWSTSGSTSNFASRVIWNITNPMPSMGTSYGPLQDGVLNSRRLRGASSLGYWASNSMIITYVLGVNAEDGTIAYNNTLGVNPADPDTWIWHHAPASGSGYGLFYFEAFPYKDPDVGFIAVDVHTGQLAWTNAPADYPWGDAWAYMPNACGYGMIIGLAYNGVYAFNATNGERVWHLIDEDVYNEEPYGSNVAENGTIYQAYGFGSTGPVLGGGYIYAPNSEHSPTFIYRGEGLLCIDAATGEKVWKIVGQWSPDSMAYGILLAHDSYNGFSYAFGKGETETTVAPSSKVIAKGDSILLEGTVLDMSPAQKGTAAVSDADQTGWMEYLHMQQPFPATATGVSVSLDALDPNMNYVHLGDAMTDLTGQYSFAWTPDIEGKYTIVASFANSGAYYGSTAETAALVTPAPAASPTPEPTEQAAIDYTWIFIGLGIAIIIAIAIATLLIVRK